MAALGGQTSGASYMGGKNTVGVNDGGHPESGPKPDKILETPKVPESNRQRSPIGGGMPAPAAASIQPEVPDTLLAALKGASIIDEHRAFMGAVIEKIQSAESGLNESCISLIEALRYVL